MNILKLLFFHLFVLNITFHAQSTYLTLTSPIKDENLIAGSKFYITWSSINVEQINIYYSIDNGDNWIIIKSSVDATKRQYFWKVPRTSSNRVKVKITDSANPKIKSISNHSFSIVSNYYKNKNLHKITSNNSKLRIMLLGDSITRGIVGSSNETGYRRYLYNQLFNMNYGFNFIGSLQDGIPTDFDRDHEGHGGWSASEPLNRSKSLVDSVYKFLSQNPPNEILLHIGTNDIGRLSVENENIFGLVNEVSAILDSVDLFEQNNSTEILVFVAKIIKSLDDPSTTDVVEDDTTSAFNIALEAMLNNRISQGDNIVIVDQESAVNSQVDLSDGVHPNDSGYQKMANVWFSYLTQSLPVIVQQPVSRGGFMGDIVKYEIIAESETSLQYQWMKNDEIVTGAVNENFEYEIMSSDDNGAKFKCVLTNKWGEVISKEATLFLTDTDKRVNGGELVLYDFDEGSGTRINDVSNINPLVDLTINTPSSISWIEKGIEINSSATITSDFVASKIIDSCIETNEITLEIWMYPKNYNQVGASRIITMSNDSLNRNFSLVQSGDVLTFPLRTTGTNNNGHPSISASIGSFTESLLHVVFSKSNTGNARIYVNGNEQSSSLIPGDFSNWEPNYFLGLANEFTNSMPWLGNLYFVSIFNRYLSPTEILHNYTIGIPGLTNLNSPSDLYAELNGNQNVSLSWIDNSDNESGFIIERSKSNNDGFVDIDTVTVDVINYLDENLIDGTKYYYRIKSFNNIVKSTPSNEVNITLPLPAPNNLTAETNATNQVILTWSDNSESERIFVVEGKADHPDSVYTTIDSVANNINNFLDETPKFYSPYKYRVYGLSNDTVSAYSNSVSLNVVDIINKDNELPKEYILKQNYPNPFNPTTIIQYSIPVTKSEFNKNISIVVYDNLGRKILTLINKPHKPGNYFIKLNLSDYNSGVYFYRLKSDNFSSTKKLLLIK